MSSPTESSEVKRARAVLAIIEGGGRGIQDRRLPSSERGLFSIRGADLVEIRSEQRGGARIPTVTDTGILIFTDLAMRFYGGQSTKVWRWADVTGYDEDCGAILVPVSSRQALAGVAVPPDELDNARLIIGWAGLDAVGADPQRGFLDLARQRLVKLVSAPISLAAPPRPTPPAPPPTLVSHTQLVRSPPWWKHPLAIPGAVVAALVVITLALISANWDTPEPIAAPVISEPSTARPPQATVAPSATLAPTPSPSPHIPPIPTPSSTPSPAPAAQTISGIYSGKLEVTRDWSNMLDEKRFSREGEKYPVTITVPATCDLLDADEWCIVDTTAPVIGSEGLWKYEMQRTSDTGPLIGEAVTDDDCIDSDSKVIGSAESIETISLKFLWPSGTTEQANRVQVKFTWDTDDDIDTNDCDADYHAKGTLTRTEK